jgi:3D (Asp-Asp-Asp) domain-containing protein
MNLLASALVAGILFLPSAGHIDASTTPAAVDDPSPSQATAAKTVAPTYQVKLTGYNAVPEQTDGDPSTTASGVPSNPEVIAARSLDLAGELPFGTVIQVTRIATDTPGCNFHKVAPQIGYRVIADTMNARWTKRVDIELDQKKRVKVDGHAINPGLALGVCSSVTVKVIGHIDINAIPDTQDELAQMLAPGKLALK